MKPLAKRTVIIGDVHACKDELLELLDKCQVISGDRVVLAGDLVDRGPDPRGVIELAMEHHFDVIMGNHEEATLRRRRKDPSELAAHHLFTVQQLEDKHFNWIDSLPLYLELPEYDAVVVHAAVVPDVSIARQKAHLLLHGQNVRPPAARGRTAWQPTGETWGARGAPPESAFWTTFYRQKPRVFFGHTVLTAPYVTDYVVGLDTGCCFGGELTAYVLPDERVVQVKARQAYFAPRTERIPLAGDVAILT